LHRAKLLYYFIFGGGSSFERLVEILLKIPSSWILNAAIYTFKSIVQNEKGDD